VSALCEKIAIALGMGEETVNEVRMAGLMHDIGKITISEDILNKVGPLSQSERIEISKHAEAGYHILKSVSEYSKIAEYSLTHHERLDGKGYPKGLKSAEIPYVSKIVSVAEAYDAMVNNVINNRCLDENEAINELLKNAGIQFDVDIVNVFIEKVLKIEV
jgi:HD-GYP domain-containing protein (c-di-GMP phosphodiesterase class II)